MGWCIVYTGIRLLLLFCPFIQFSFSSIFKHLNFSSHFSQKLWGLDGWSLQCSTHVDRGQMYRVYWNQAAAAYLSLYSVFFLSNFQTLKFFVTLFSGTVRPRRLILGAHMDNGWMYRVYRNQAAAAYLSLYFCRGARWLSGRVSDSGARGPGFETYRRRVVSLSKTLYSPKVLVNYPGSDGSVPTWLKNCWLGR